METKTSTDEELDAAVEDAMQEWRGMRKPGTYLKMGIEPERGVNTWLEKGYGKQNKKAYWYDAPRKERLYGKEYNTALDGISDGLAVASMIPGVDTITDIVSIPVDLLRGDYKSAAYDLIGVIPYIGEIGDTAKLARMGIKAGDAVSDVSDAAKTGEKILESADEIADSGKVIGAAGDKAEDIYSATKVDGTIKGYLDEAADPIAELSGMSKSIAKTSPVKIPDGAKMISQKKDGYYQIKYIWMDADGYKYEARWHTRTPEAPLSQRDTWVISRHISGIGSGANHRKGYTDVLIFNGAWIDKGIWDDAVFARKRKTTTQIQEEILKYGHHKV